MGIRRAQTKKAKVKTKGQKMIKRAWELNPGDEVMKRGKPVYVEIITLKGNDIEIDFSDGTFRLIERYAQFKVLNFEADVEREIKISKW